MLIATVNASSPKLELVKEEPMLGDAPIGQPHASRLSPSFRNEAMGMGLMTMDKDNHLHLTWKAYLVIAASIVLLVGSNWYSHSVGVDEGVSLGREQREKEFILKSIDQMNNIKTALNMNFPDSKQPTPETKENK